MKECDGKAENVGRSGNAHLCTGQELFDAFMRRDRGSRDLHELNPIERGLAIKVGGHRRHAKDTNFEIRPV